MQIYMHTYTHIWGFLGSSAGKESACNTGRPQFNSWVRKIPWRRVRLPTPVFLGFSGGSDSKESACSVGDLSLIPGLGRSPEGGHNNPLQYYFLENPKGQRSLVGYSPFSHKESHTTKHSTVTYLLLSSFFLYWYIKSNIVYLIFLKKLTHS